MPVPTTIETPKVRVVKAITELAEQVYGEDVWVDVDVSPTNDNLQYVAVHLTDDNRCIMEIEDEDAHALLFAMLREKKRILKEK